MNGLAQDIKTLLTLAWPVVISRVGILTLGITDTVMVGRYASEHLAYLGIGMVPSNIFILIMIGLLMGTSVLVSNRFGAGQFDKTGEVLWQALPWGFVIGLVGFLFCYFGEFWLLLTGQEATLAAKGGHISIIAGLSLPLAAVHMTTGFFLEGIRNPRPGMVIMIAANIINIFANYVLVYGVYGFPELGAEGSIWATFIVRCMQVVAILSYVWFFIDHEKYGLRRPKITWAGGTELRRIGYASGISMGLENGAFNALVLFAGFLGTAAIAAHIIMINVFAVFFMMGLGFGAATAVSVGNANGAGDMRLVTRWAWLGLSIQSLVMVAAGIVMFVMAQPLGAFFSTDPAVYNLAAAMIAWVAVALVFDTGQSLLAMALRARGDTWAPTLIHLLAYGVVMIPLAYIMIFPLGRGAMGLADGVILGTLVPFVLVMWRYRQLDRRAKLQTHSAEQPA
jgi:MATE family multidrug resistance protein